ncbi:MAG TPA: hypothetical protein ENN14_02145 [Chloroflexi bacterium]|nr:hypothetical protein [Chloroflexota bacterium]
MFKIGDKVVHPAYGGGTIVQIEERNIAGELTRYYAIELVLRDGLLLVPVERAEELGVRLAVEDIQSVIAALGAEPNELPDNLRGRAQKQLSADIHSGDVIKVTEVVRDLAHRKAADRVTKTDLDLLSDAEDFLAVELALSQELDLDSARSQIEAALNLPEFDEDEEEADA